jgi:ABC-type phosphate/phosphonate transport system substrate-binding protein
MLPAVNRSDAIASMMVFVRALAKNQGFEVDSKVEVLRTVEEMAARLKEKSVDLLVLDTPHHLALTAANLIEVVAAGTNHGQVGAYPYLLLVRDSSTLAGLQGKRVVVSSRTKADLGMVWLETLLSDNRLGRAVRHFESVATTYKPSACILPLSFGRIDACIVDAYGWELAKELNPQLAKLKTVAHSEPLVEGAIAVPTYPHPYRQEMFTAMLELHGTPAGHQLVTLFKTGPLVRARKEYFDSIRTLMARYAQLPLAFRDIPPQDGAAAGRDAH